MTQIVSFHDPATPGTVRITDATRAGLLASIEGRLVAGEGFALATVNLDHLVKLRRDPRFHEAYLAQSHVVADGNPVVWLSRLAGRRVELIPGSELVLPLAGLAARHDVPVALLGATEAALERAAEGLRAVHPGLRIVARIAPPMGFDPEGETGTEALAALAASGARLCFLALGAPKQERLAARGLRDCPGGGSSRSARGWISSPEPSGGRRSGCSAWRWNGPGGWPATPAAWPPATPPASRSCRGWG